MKDEMEYKIHVEPAIRTIINKVAADCEGFGISPDQFTRALWSWADDQIQRNYDTPPQWLWMELDNKRHVADALNTIDGTPVE